MIFLSFSEHGRSRDLVHWPRRRISGVDSSSPVSHRYILHIMGQVIRYPFLIFTILYYYILPDNVVVNTGYYHYNDLPMLQFHDNITLKQTKDNYQKLIVHT